MDALAGVDHRTFGLDQHVGDFDHILRVRTGAGAHDGGVVERLGDFVVERVVGNLDDDRLRPAVTQLRERAAEDVGYLGPDGDRLGMLGDTGHLQG